MGHRARPPANARETIFGPAPITAEEAFVRFGNACHWEAELGPAHGSPRSFVQAALARIPRTQHRLVAECISDLTGGTHTFGDVRAIWRRARNDTMVIDWEEPEDCIRFLLLVRDMIDPHAWPAARPRFRSDPGVRQSER